MRMVAFSQEIFDRICDRIANGESLRAICRDDDMPSGEAVRKWLAKDESGELVAQYARAREAQADTLFDDILTIVDTATTETVGQARLQMDARRWMAGKLKPKVYGEKQVIEGPGEGGALLVKWQD